MMSGKERREEILQRITNSKTPVSGAALAKSCEVSRQVIVQDIALIRAAGYDVIATNRGYICSSPVRETRVFEVNHTDEQMQDELNTIVDFGGVVLDVIVRHEVYGELRAELNISSRNKVALFMEEIRQGKSRPLKNITSGEHFHTVSADSAQTLARSSSGTSPCSPSKSRMASRLTEIYYRPAVVLTRTNDMATGSARSVSGFDVYKAIEHCRDLLENFGGHTYAAGLSMKVENVPAFTERFETFVSQHILPEQTSAVIDIDAEIDFRDITPKFFSDLKKFNPFGPDNQKPIFCTHHVYDYGTSKVVGRDQEHIKLELVDNKSNNVMNGIAFGQSSHVRYIKTKRSFDICYTIEENTHKRGEVQLQIEDIKPIE